MNGFDTYLYKLINQQWVHEELDTLMLYFSDKFFWIPFYCIVIWMLSRQLGKRMWPVLLGLILSVVAADRITSGVMKPLIGRTRPCHEVSLTPRVIEGVNCSDTGSMASSHAANHFAIAIFMILIYGFSARTNLVFWLLWASVVAYSRVYLGVHYPTDIMAGALVGALCGWAAYKLYDKFGGKLMKLDGE